MTEDVVITDKQFAEDVKSEDKVVIEKLTPTQKAAITRANNKEKKQKELSDKIGREEQSQVAFGDRVIKWSKRVKRDADGNERFTGGDYKLGEFLIRIENEFGAFGKIDYDPVENTITVKGKFGYVDCLTIFQPPVNIIKRLQLLKSKHLVSGKDGMVSDG